MGLNIQTAQLFLITLNQILTAGIAITALSLLLFSLQFNLRDRVARSFAFILTCVMIIFAAEAIGSAVTTQSEVDFWLRLEWIGIILLPTIYLLFSDALLTTTGKPSYGKRYWAIRVAYIFSLMFLLALPFPEVFGFVSIGVLSAPQFQPTLVTIVFTVFYLVLMGLSWFNFIRSFRRTTTPTSRRRMSYLIMGALAPALGSFPYMVFGAGFAGQHQILFWSIAVISNIFVGGLIIVMAYSVAFFGVSWPDRVVKNRLFNWIMRGPVTVSLALGFTTIIRRGGEMFGVLYGTAIPIVMVITILVFEYLISIFGPLMEKWLFLGNDRTDLDMLRTFEDRFLTRNDLKQFLELILAAICDRLQSPGAFIAVLDHGAIELVVKVGENRFGKENETEGLIELVQKKNGTAEMFHWGDDLLVSLAGVQDDPELKLMGLLGVTEAAGKTLDEEQKKALKLLSQRVEMALDDRNAQREIFQSFQDIQPDVELIQRIRAAGQYGGSNLLTGEIELPPDDMAQWVKDALSHFWGGPRLTESPLMQLKVVRDSIGTHDGSNTNALRSILRESIDRVRPEGERRFTGEWILYNILEMKFLEGRKVREIALRLAMSEADLYRKQRIAIETIAKEIREMEVQARYNSV
ncbi:MAG: hypothetical protein MUO76_20650 [Anaerolineaceae bacterium]|nr:hypothetical protein [Anaerolineaceae bacterium]